MSVHGAAVHREEAGDTIAEQVSLSTGPKHPAQILGKGAETVRTTVVCPAGDEIPIAPSPFWQSCRYRTTHIVPTAQALPLTCPIASSSLDDLWRGAA